MNRSTVVILVVIAMVLVIWGIAKQKETQAQEIKYQAGINLIKQGKWDDAATQLILLHDANYKDSAILYNYSQAKKEAQDKNYSQAAYNMAQIPDSYNGIMKSEILQFKKEILQQASKLTPDQIQKEQQKIIQEAPGQNITVTLLNTKVVDGKYRWFFDIRNKGETSFEGSVEIILKNKLGNVVTRETFETNKPIDPKLGTYVYIDTNTGPPEVHGEYGISSFSFVVNQ